MLKHFKVSNISRQIASVMLIVRDEVRRMQLLCNAIIAKCFSGNDSHALNREHTLWQLFVEHGSPAQSLLHVRPSYTSLTL
jgi:hypothetical protein